MALNLEEILLVEDAEIMLGELLQKYQNNLKALHEMITGGGVSEDISETLRSIFNEVYESDAELSILSSCKF